MNYKKAQNSGFTLLELMIAVVIIGILTVVAVPSYQEHVRTTQRAAAQADLMELASNMERYFSENNTYIGAPIVDNNPHYALTSPVLNATAYTLTATPVVGGSQQNDICGTMTFNQASAQTAARADCWRQ